MAGGARSTWKGQLQIGLVQFPVKAYTATENGYGIKFNELHAACKHRVNYKKICAHCNVDALSAADIISGYEYAPGQFVTVTDEEKKGIQIPSTHSIAITDVVEDIDPVRFDKAYYLAADAKAGSAFDAYATIREALGTSYGIGKMATRGREYTVAIRSQGNFLVMHTLCADAEIRKPQDIVGFTGNAPNAQAVSLAKQMIAMLTRADFDFAALTDEYQSGLDKVIKAKVAGEEIEVPVDAPATETTTNDLLAALKASLADVEMTNLTNAVSPEKKAAKGKAVVKTRKVKKAS